MIADWPGSRCESAPRANGRAVERQRPLRVRRTSKPSGGGAQRGRGEVAGVGPRDNKKMMVAVLISTYDMGRQPFGLASPAAWLRARGWDVTVVDLAKQKMDETVLAAAEL